MTLDYGKAFQPRLKVKLPKRVDPWENVVFTHAGVPPSHPRGMGSAHTKQVVARAHKHAAYHAQSKRSAGAIIREHRRFDAARPPFALQGRAL